MCNIAWPVLSAAAGSARSSRSGGGATADLARKPGERAAASVGRGRAAVAVVFAVPAVGVRWV